MEDMFIEVYLGHKRLENINLATRKLDLILKGEVYKGIIPAIIRPITKVAVVDC